MLLSGCLGGAGPRSAAPPPPPEFFITVSPTEPDSNVRAAVERLDLERFKETIRELSRYDRTSNSPQHLQAVNFIETQLQQLGYENIERFNYSTQSFENVNLYVTKVGTRFPDEVLIVSASVDASSVQGADANASGCALLLELARVLASPDVQLDRSVRIMFFNGGDRRHLGSELYANTMWKKQGAEAPGESGRYPEPRWLGVVEHHMILYDHGLPERPVQAPGADLDIEYVRRSRERDASAALARLWQLANALYASSYPAKVGDQLVNSHAFSFRDYVASINVSENPRFQMMQRTSRGSRRDYFHEYREEDFMFGFNAVQTSMGGVGHVAGLRILK